MEIITIEVKHEAMTVVSGKSKNARLVWRAPGLEVYVQGSIADKLLNDQARTIALNACIERHIPCVSLRYQKVGKSEYKTSKKLDTYTKPLF